MIIINTTEILIYILRTGIFGDKLNVTVKDNLNEDVLKELFDLSAKHDLVNIVADVLFKNKLVDSFESANLYKQVLFLSMLRYQQQKLELETVSKLLSDNEIAFIPLKGAVLRDYYPEPWLRTSSDIDILVQKQDFEKASKLLEDVIGYKVDNRTLHDVCYTSQSGVNVELHHSLIEQASSVFGVNKRNWSLDLFSKVWDYSYADTDCPYKYKLTNEMFYIYHIAHIAKHFENGGCGIRMFADLHLILNNFEIDNQKLKEMLDASKLTTFNDIVVHLSNVWFGNKNHTDASKIVEEFIIGSGVLGSIENHVWMKQNKVGGRYKYLFSRVFYPYESLKLRYPNLENKKWLLPYYQVKRWCGLLNSGRIKNVTTEIDYAAKVNNKEMTANEFLNIIGL